MREKKIQAGAGDATTILCMDTIKQDKQALVFCASKKAAESQAEKVAKKRRKEEGGDRQKQLAEKALAALSQPTKQCRRLAYCLENGVAFHHAGLPQKQRELIETEFRNGAIHIICSTPTLAAGLDLPAFRTVIRDHKRFSGMGMTPIPVLEYLQMAGRAGRPGMERFGEAILVAGSSREVERLTEQYIKGNAEDIHSKLAVEPVLRTYILSLVATEIITSTEELKAFFSRTFYAKQFGNMRRLEATLMKMIRLLKTWEFLETKDENEQNEKDQGSENEQAGDLFKNADEVESERQKEEEEILKATSVGKRVSEIYLDPLTAHIILKGLAKLKKHKLPKEDEEQAFAVQHLISCSLEMRPLLRTRTATAELVENKMAERQVVLLDEADFYEYSQDDYEDTILTATFLNDWAKESSEQELLEKYGIRPGEITAKLQRSEWLLYACEELARVTKKKQLLAKLRHIALRTKHGVRAELLPLLNFKGIGRVRARHLHMQGITKVSDVKRVQMERLAEILGRKTAKNIKEQAGVSTSKEPEEEEVKQDVREKQEEEPRGQTNLNHF